MSGRACSEVARGFDARTRSNLTRQRQEFAGGAVLENIQAEQEVPRAPLELLNAIAEYNRAGHVPGKLVGHWPAPDAPPARSGLK